MLHPLITADPDAPLMLCWMDPDNQPHFIGEHDDVLALRTAIDKYLAFGTVGDPILDTDPRWGNSFDIGDAVAEAEAFGYTDNPERMANTIRAACRAGRIRGAMQTDTGRWMIPRRPFRYWLQSYVPKPRA